MVMSNWLESWTATDCGNGPGRMGGGQVRPEGRGGPFGSQERGGLEMGRQEMGGSAVEEVPLDGGDTGGGGEAWGPALSLDSSPGAAVIRRRLKSVKNACC